MGSCDLSPNKVSSGQAIKVDPPRSLDRVGPELLRRSRA